MRSDDAGRVSEKGLTVREVMIQKHLILQPRARPHGLTLPSPLSPSRQPFRGETFAPKADGSHCQLQAFEDVSFRIFGNNGKVVWLYVPSGHGFK